MGKNTTKHNKSYIATLRKENKHLLKYWGKHKTNPINGEEQICGR